MHYGQFPCLEVGPQPYPVGTTEINEDAPAIDRRTALVGGIGAILGIGAASAARGLTASAASPPPTPPPKQAEPRGTLEWALDLHQATDEALLDAAGDLERTSLRSHNDRRLLPLFSRLLDVALTSDELLVDVAGQCAVRSLDRGGRRDWVLLRKEPIRRHQRMRRTAALVREIERR